MDVQTLELNLTEKSTNEMSNVVEIFEQKI